MRKKRIETIVKELIHPFLPNDREKLKLKCLVRKYGYELVVDSAYAGAEQYLVHDKQGQLNEKVVRNFFNQLGGIVYNKSLPPIEQEIRHINSVGKSTFPEDWDSRKGKILLHNYVTALKYSRDWQEKTILDDLRGDTLRYTRGSKNWSNWSEMMQAWIDYLYNSKKDSSTIEQSGTILPEGLFVKLPSNFCSICKQINASYENNLYDCTAVMMRRLLEDLLVLSYQNAEIENEIMANDGKYHVSLDSMIKNAVTNSKLALSCNTKNDMRHFKDLGNYSAHKIWYNCTKEDLEPHIHKYRVVIEELFYKSGIKK
ncbi:DUF4145 domain-containing protein [bacterium]|nr:DUF4145 domain-containing protein [bacterium]